MCARKIPKPCTNHQPSTCCMPRWRCNVCQSTSQSVERYMSRSASSVHGSGEIRKLLVGNQHLLPPFRFVNLGLGRLSFVQHQKDQRFLSNDT
jgi:hypothetical protein